MRLVLGKKGDKEPFQCGVCGRAATAIGYMPNDRYPIMWLCDEGACVSQAKWIYGMKEKDLNFWEGRALERAAQSITDPLIEAVMTMLWERKIENLNQIDSDKFNEITKSATDTNQLTGVLRNFLLEFSYSLRSELESRDPPF
jgi:hypothetical protein